MLDPFMGSGTTVTVAERMGRDAIGVEILREYYDMVAATAKPSPKQLVPMQKRVPNSLEAVTQS